jgi:hypothetical protein
MFGLKKSNQELEIEMQQLATSLPFFVGDRTCSKV